MKRITAAVLSVLLTLTLLLSGCSGSGSSKVTVTSLAQAGQTAVMEAESYDATMIIDMGMEETYMGITFDVGAVMELYMTVNQASQSSYMTGSMTVSMLGMTSSSDVESYTVPEDDHFVSYTQTSADGVTTGWVCEEMDTSSMEVDLTNVYQSMLDDADAFTLEEELTDVDGVSCYMVTGSLPAETVNEIMDFMTSEMLGDAADGDEIGNTVEIVMYFRESDQTPYQLEMIYDMDISYEESGVEVAISSLMTTFRYNSFNSVGEIMVPEDVIASATKGDATSLDVGIEFELEDEDWDDEDGDWYWDYDEDSDYDWDWDDDDSGYDYSVGGALASTAGLTGFTLDGAHYELNGPVQDFLDNGWELPYEDTVDGDDYDHIWLDKGISTVYIGLYNTQETEADQSDCRIFEISIYAGEGRSFVFDNGIDWNTTYAEAVALLGEPSTSFLYEDGFSYYYWATADDKFEMTMIYDGDEVYGLEVVDYGPIF